MSVHLITNGVVHRLLGSFGVGGSLVGAIGPLSSDTYLLLAAAIVFALATWRSRAPGLLRQDNQALAGRLKTRERELDETKAERAKLAGRLEAAEQQIAELKAKDTSALFDLMTAHDLRSNDIGAKLTALLEQLVAAA